MSNTQTPPFVSVSGCTKIIYLPAGIKIFYGLDLSKFTYPVLGAYYAITSDGTDGGTLDSLYVYNGSVFVKILEPIDKNVKLASDYNTLGLTAGQSQEDFNKAVASQLDNIPTKTSELENDSEFITKDEVPSSETTEEVIATTTIGGINAGEVIDAGTDIQELVKLLFDKVYYPTYTPHNFGLTNNAGLREVGSSFNITLTFNFDRGKILGKLVNNSWLKDEPQSDKLGVATSYLLNGVSSANNSATMAITTISGTNILEGTVTYATGAQPKDSKGNNFESPFPAGTSPVQNTSFEGIYPYFYYKSMSPITPAIMQSAIANGQATKVLASSTGTITIDFDANGEYIAVAYPATSTTKAIWYVNALDNGEIPGGLLGVANTLPCNSPTNLWNNVNFKIHVSAGLITQTNPIQLKNS